VTLSAYERDVCLAEVERLLVKLSRQFPMCEVIADGKALTVTVRFQGETLSRYAPAEIWERVRDEMLQAMPARGPLQ
jgi:hypothetical protein